MQMSTAHFRAAALLLCLSGLFCGGLVRAEALQPFKDALFSDQPLLETRDGGDFQVVDYQEMRDINGRDQIPERRVKSKYVDLGVKRQQVNETLQFAAGNLDVARVGPASGAAFTVIFIHGRGGDRRLGVNDFSFGGNFNRLKNLAVQNGGVYYAPSVRSFDVAGVQAIAGLIGYAAAQSPGRPVVLSCASMGSFICWGITRDAGVVADLAGMAILGGATDPDFNKSAAYKAKLPIFFTHGSRDSVYAATDQIALYDRLHKAGYPTRFTLYETGSHGTPVRMSDWRAVLNWILVQRR
ncbi:MULTISPECIES: alpha/beta hydrolase [Alphaproteobacteria]|uniref:Phospholipase n=2 Tax=Alphaproteobacteria TaxID=28211 RepID=A0A512HCS6_9HYPH|nr:MULTISPECIES: alpha/beta hydrolase [Alphaproteobacteria]GEO83243.1 phospholipase [Ciceribacter naphthalenivorans]GLR20362.1 phospholipase [Ciceribacter naphthalenivorans]GLT03218.1 phospholipase [Sphingomonas psychrolutea]